MSALWGRGFPRSFARSFSTAKPFARSFSTAKSGFFELRVDTVAPGQISSFLVETSRIAALPQVKKQLPAGFKGMWKTELGGSLNKVYQLYHWDSYDQRDATCSSGFEVEGNHSPVEMANMMLPFPTQREKLTEMRSMVMNEATECLQAAGLPGALQWNPPHTDASKRPAVAYELRTYQLVLGYSTVPKFLELYSAGLRDKLEADDSGASSLASLLYSDSGSLNVVMELWRHESLERSQASRQASRKATKWRDAINEIAGLSVSFDTQFLRPLPLSPWQ